ncbi:amylo-alpha-1,6-glucosidase [Cohnella endophytica]|uniref:Amylo-alpha-1,6-glucosidase n=1 Tax=Cohnella endophytica TaxID=2419778 RepID=A0A494X904_9BACL|nr:amylo-alpha-1,6-glucosidase [Cohnella endophytica]RKP46712.1 amylo-alpha-1,6-glucosidase [Cohnella endophytica]
MDYRVIKENDLFLLTDRTGDIPEGQKEGLGLYTKDTRFLSRMELKINGVKPIVLASEADQNYISTIILTNPHMEEAEKLVLWRESIELRRTRFIYESVLYETLKATNFSPYACSFELSIKLDADFTDMFVVRGFMGGKLGSRTETVVEDNAMTFGYAGSDNIGRELKFGWSGLEGQIGEDGSVTFGVSLEAAQSTEIELYMMPIFNGDEPKLYPKEQAIRTLKSEYERWNEGSVSISSDLPLYDALYDRGIQDLRVLISDIGYGPFPVAGLPWYAVPFGRDSLIAALQMLPIKPEIALGTLRTMAHFQGEKLDGWRDEQPGKIMHELRKGELANTNQVPFGPYFGSIDSTPLFLVLLAEYVTWTEDVALLKELMPNVLSALDWIEQYGEREGSLFTSYFKESEKGIANQGWKDSADSVVHRDGRYAKAPIALVEVQGYVYQAKNLLATLFKTLPQAKEGELDVHLLAERLSDEAEQLRVRFEAEFWIPEEQYYAIALDHENKQVVSITSNPGHALMSGLFAPERAAAVAKRLVSPALFSGYGIRTMAEGETGYNPMSYHDGSVWPHDNSMCLIGLSALGFSDEANVVIEGLLNAAQDFENYRLPELFCGYSSAEGKPVRYPVSCSPQAWAAGTPLVFVTSALGIRLDYASRTIRMRPSLPNGMNRLTVRGLRLGAGRIDVEITRSSEGYKLDIANTSGWKVEQAQTVMQLQ